MAWRDLGGSARSVGAAVSQAVTCAARRDGDEYRAAVAELLALPADQSGQVLAALVLELLEEQHPDGLDSDDIVLVLGRCYQATKGWLPPDLVDAHALIAVLASALGIHEPGVTYEEVTTGPVPSGGPEWVDPVGGTVLGGMATAPVTSRVPTAAGYAWHAPLLVADLLSVGRRPLDRYLDRVFAEIHRAETMELP